MTQNRDRFVTLAESGTPAIEIRPSDPAQKCDTGACVNVRRDQTRGQLLVENPGGQDVVPMETDDVAAAQRLLGMRSKVGTTVILSYRLTEEDPSGTPEFGVTSAEFLGNEKGLALRHERLSAYGQPLEANPSVIIASPHDVAELAKLALAA